MDELIIIGGGLAGCEAAWQAAQRNIKVRLYEMRPMVSTGAHTTDMLAELVCSNSFGSNLFNRGSGLLNRELKILGSFLLECSESAALPAGSALAVDRELFSHLVTEKISGHPNIHLVRKEMTEIPNQATIIASGPLTSPCLASSISQVTGKDNLFFFDAIAPIVIRESIDMRVAFKGARFQRGISEEGDYINCPLSKTEYDNFVTNLIHSERTALQSFEDQIPNGVQAGSSRFFQGCLPIEITAERSQDALAYGPMRPSGLYNPHSNVRPYAVVQLRQENKSASLYNIVGFQTNLTQPEQKRVIRMIPGLEDAVFIRLGQMHRNTFIESPLLIDPTLQFRTNSNLFFAGQITGVEGYLGNIATGLLAGINAERFIRNQPLIELPKTTMLGALMSYISTSPPEFFQPMKANFGLLPGLETPIRQKNMRNDIISRRAIADLRLYLNGLQGFEFDDNFHI
jgi:methylenetetrahydrofolate--tRNA-(uracil-5-)-methyltransferase